MIRDADLFEANPEDHEYIHPVVPDYETEFIDARTFLQKGSAFSGDNLYDHLTDVLNKILSERPENVVDFFEEYSRKVKEKRFKPMTDRLEDIYVSPGRYKLATKLMPLLVALPPEDPSTLDPEERALADMSKNNMLELLYYFEHVGLGLPRTEMYCITLSMRKLIRTEPIASIRFWGKIYGLEKNYLIVETELKDDEYIKRNQEIEDIPDIPPIIGDQLLESKLNMIAQEQQMGEGVPSKLQLVFPPLPVSTYEEPPVPPNEISGVGLNKKVYYVCNEVGEPWIQLPDVTAKEIRVARKIYKAFSGNLDQQIVSYPSFLGTERNYLRAQIARISASTHISPLGYYSFGGDELGEGEGMDEEADEGLKTEFKENLKYDPLPLKDLTDKSIMFWVHHSPYILPQGRITWWNPNPLPDVQDEELGEEGEEKPMTAGPEPETGPPLLTPCSEDVTLDAIPAWSVRCSTGIADEFGIAVVRSNFWPGAYCFANQGRLFQNIYLGSGNKFLSPNFSPSPLPGVEQDYPIGPEIMEIVDPTGQEEEDWRIAHLPKPKPIPVLKGEGEEAEEEEEEDEDEDD